MEYYSAIKKNAFESVLMRWMKLEPIIQSEVSQKEKHQYSILMHTYGIQKEGNDNSVSCIKPELAIHFTYDNIHVSMLLSQIIPPLPSPTESKSLFFTSVSLLLSHI